MKSFRSLCTLSAIALFVANVDLSGVSAESLCRLENGAIALQSNGIVPLESQDLIAEIDGDIAPCVPQQSVAHPSSVTETSTKDEETKDDEAEDDEAKDD
ncbi:unnamed protein product [Aphanomyces euteiches]